MAIEAKRGCGYRKRGGLYLVGEGNAIGCHRLPMNVHVCPVCSSGIKYSRGFTWFDPFKFFGNCEHEIETDCHKHHCNVCFPPSGKHGLMWIGKKFYTPSEFTAESVRLGVSKRISAIPRNFVLGETWIYLAHLEAGEMPEESETEIFKVKRVPAIFYCFKPTAIEKIISETEAKDPVEMEKLKRAGITPVVVPDDDADHTGSVHDKNEEE